MRIGTKFRFSLLAILLVVSFGCDISQTEEDASPLDGLYVLNQGNFTDGVASITVYDPQADSVQQNAFKNRNGRPLGSVGQSMTQLDGKLYTVINNSHKVEVMDPENLQSIGTIQFGDSLSPRYMIQARNGVAYVTNWAGFSSPGYVSVVNLSNNEIIKHIEVGVAPEQLARVGTNVYVANGGLGSGNTLTVINAGNDQVTGQVKVDDYPTHLSVDASANLWVLCQGATNSFNDPDDDTPGKLYMIDSGDGTKLDSLKIGLDLGSSRHPKGMSLNNDDGLVYLLKGGIHTISMNSMSLSETGFIEGNLFAVEYSGMGEERRVYAADAKGFDQAGKAYIYDLDGNAVDSFQTAVGPGDFHFKVSNR